MLTSLFWQRVACCRDEDGEEREALKPKLTFNPFLQRLYQVRTSKFNCQSVVFTSCRLLQCLNHRQLHPDDPLPDLSSIESCMKPLRAVEAKSEGTLEELKTLFPLKRVEETKVEEAAGGMAETSSRNNEKFETGTAVL